MLKVGITGGIGSGKSTVCEIFKTIGIPVYSADQRAKELMHEDAVLKEQVKEHFGSDIYDSSGILQRSQLASRVFGNDEKVKLLNSLVHPAVFRDYDAWAAKQDAPYILKEAALLYESGSFRDQDYMITVSAPEELRISRVMQRDGVKRDDVLARMKNQLSEEERLERADFIIKNDGKHSLIRQVLELHQKFITASLG